MQITDFQLVKFRRFALDVLDPGLASRHSALADGLLRKAERYRLFREIGIGRKLGEDPNQLAGACIFQISDALENVVRERDMRAMASELLEAQFHDAESRLAIGLAERDDKTTRKSRPHIGPQRVERLRRTIGGNDNSPAQVGERVHGVQEFRNRRGTAANMLKIV